MTHIDDLERGMFVTIIEDFNDDGQQPAPYEGFSYFGQQQPRSKPLHFINGLPLEILEISLPFICVATGRDGHDRFAIDTRNVRLQRVSRRYAAMMLEELGEKAVERSQERRRKPTRRRQLTPEQIAERTERLCKYGFQPASKCSSEDRRSDPSAPVPKASPRPQGSVLGPRHHDDMRAGRIAARQGANGSG